MSDTTAARRVYAEDIRNREQISSSRLLRALSTVPRERFLGKGPWRLRSEMVRNYWSTESADPIHLYQDVLVAIDEVKNWTLDYLVYGPICSIFSTSKRMNVSRRWAAVSDIIPPSCQKWWAWRGGYLPLIVTRSWLSEPEQIFGNTAMLR